jgi:hypothetical protein
MVIEAYIRKLRLPMLDDLFYRALSERTTVTIPYSRIVDFRLRRFLGWRISLTVLCWLPLLAVMSPGAFGLQRGGRYVAEALMMAFMATLLPTVLLTVFIHFWLFAPRFMLIYRRPDGRARSVVFSIRSRPAREAFVRTLEDNRKAAAKAMRIPGAMAGIPTQQSITG